MRKFLTSLIVIPLAFVFLVFAVANRHFVSVSFDPFDSTNPALAVKLPLFLLIIVVAILGVIAGGSATWVRQRHWRRAARQHEADAQAARTQLADLQGSNNVSRYHPPALPRGQVGSLSDAGRRDKLGVTL